MYIYFLFELPFFNLVMSLQMEGQLASNVVWYIMLICWCFHCQKVKKFSVAEQGHAAEAPKREENLWMHYDMTTKWKMKPSKGTGENFPNLGTLSCHPFFLSFSYSIEAAVGYCYRKLNKIESHMVNVFFYLSFDFIGLFAFLQWW